MLFQPSIFLDSTKYIQWSDDIKPTKDGLILSGPFIFEHISSSNRKRSKVTGQEWCKLHDICIPEGILPSITGLSTFNMPITNKPNNQNWKRKVKIQTDGKRGYDIPISCQIAYRISQRASQQL